MRSAPMAGGAMPYHIAPGEMAVTWEEQLERWARAEDENPYDDRPARAIVIETRKAARTGGSLDSPDGWRWVRTGLRDPERQAFIHAVFHRQAAPTHLAATMLAMGIEEQDPSGNRWLIEPAVRAMGARRVIDRLTELLREGTDLEKGGAASAAYWVRGDPNDIRYLEAKSRFRDEMLRQFVENESVHVRQRIIPMLSMRAEDYSSEVAALLPTATRIARSHPDSYIRHRVEIQLGAEGPFRAVPS